jgi:hypothetical protein
MPYEGRFPPPPMGFSFLPPEQASLLADMGADRLEDFIQPPAGPQQFLVPGYEDEGEEDVGGGAPEKPDKDNNLLLWGGVAAAAIVGFLLFTR